MVSGHWWGTERHTVCLSLAGGPMSLFFKLLNSIGQQMRSAHSPHPHCRDCRVLAERMVRMSSLGAWRRGAIMIANQPPSHIPLTVKTPSLIQDLGATGHQWNVCSSSRLTDSP